MQNNLTKKAKNIMLFPLGMLMLCFCSNNIHGQEYEMYPISKDKSRFNAWADNYFPKLNEPVTIKLVFTPQRDYGISRHGPGINIYQYDGSLDGFEIVEGVRVYNGVLNKDKEIQMSLTIKFTKAKVFYISANWGKNARVTFLCYVEGAFRESMEVVNLRKTIAFLKENAKNISEGEPPAGIQTVGKNPEDVGTDHHIYPRNDYEKSVIEITKQQNIELFSSLKPEYDSLLKITKKWYKKNQPNIRRKTGKKDTNSDVRINRNLKSEGIIKEDKVDKVYESIDLPTCIKDTEHFLNIFLPSRITPRQH